MSETLEQKLEKIGRLEQEILRKLAAQIGPNSDMYVSHFMMLGAAKRTVSLGKGFRTLVQARNFVCAAPLVRMQIDTALRVYAGTLVVDAESYARAVHAGEPIDKMRDRNGTRLRDAYLVEQLGKLYPWIPNVYRETSGLVHFTSRHIFAGVAKLDEESRTVHFLIGGEDPPRPDEEYFEMVDCFFEAMRITGLLTLNWAHARQQAA
jgi:hypothetical protein